MITQKINLTHIDLTDTTFVFSCAVNSERLEKSIQAVGILHPVVLQKESSSGKYRIVSGCQRVQVAGRLGYSDIEAQVYEKGEITDFILFNNNLQENLCTRALNVIEQATVIHKLLNQFGLSREDIVQQYLPIMDLGANPKIFDRLLPLIKLDAPLKLAVANDFIGIEMAAKLSCLPASDRDFFFQLCVKLKLGRNRQKELFNLFGDLSKMRRCSFTQIADLIKLETLLNDSSVQIPVKTEKLRQALRKMRRPRFSATEQKYQVIVKKLKLPRTMSLTPFPFFEEDKFTLKFEFKNREELSRQSEIIQKLLRNPALAELEKLT